MRKIVISQPMFFPWVGLFEQVKLADCYVHYDDVQFPQGRGFMNRVQIKTSGGIQWLTIPILRRGACLIKEVFIDNSQKWREKHLKTLQYNYAKTKYCDEMLDIVYSVYSTKTKYLAELNINAIEKITNYFGMHTNSTISSKYNVHAKSSEKLLQLVKLLGGMIYITGHGASNYLDHSLFEQHGIRVEYMDYQKIHYKQLHGEFTPYVSILDLIANMGSKGRDVIVSGTKYWRDYLK